MRVTAIKLLEDCLDNSMIMDFHLDEPISVPFIHYLGAQGKLEYFPHFPRPFFRITRTKSYFLKGILDNTRFQAIFIQDTERLREELRVYINSYTS